MPLPTTNNSNKQFKRRLVQRLERLSYKQNVGGSSPPPATTNSKWRCSSNLAERLSRKQKRESSNLSIASILRACSSVEQEHLSSKQKVAGSSPAKPTNSFMLRSSSSG